MSAAPPERIAQYLRLAGLESLTGREAHVERAMKLAAEKVMPYV